MTFYIQISKLLIWITLVWIFSISTSWLDADEIHPPVDTAVAHKAMQRGMNFGGVFEQKDAVNQWGKSAAWVTLTSETLERMADLYYEKGFKFFRIPFTWGTIIDENSTSGVFDQSHIKFTKYVDLVEYILNTYPDAYVMVNSHHDDWFKSQPWQAKKTLFENLWVNIATHFKNYDYRLILEIENEPFHGISDGTNTHANTIDIMKSGWDAIRGTGGNNENRILMITPLGGQHYTLNGTYGTIDKVNKVTGGDNDHVIMTIHDYGPWPFCGNVNYVAGSKGEDAPIDYIAKQNNFLGYVQWSQTMGIPINIGESGIAWRYAQRYSDGALVNEPTPKQREWFVIHTSLMETNNLSYNIWDDNGWFRVLDRNTMQFNSPIGFADSITLVGGAIWNGDFNSAPAGDSISFANTPFWQNIEGTNQTLESTRTNLTVDGSPAGVLTHYTKYTVDPGTPSPMVTCLT